MAWLLLDNSAQGMNCFNSWKQAQYAVDGKNGGDDSRDNQRCGLSLGLVRTSCLDYTGH